MLTPDYRPRAIYDIESAALYIGHVLGSPQSAREWYDDLVKCVELLCEFPDLGRPFRDDRLVVSDRRTYLVGSYRLFYSYADEKLVIWRVIHATRDIDDFALVDLID